LRLLGEGFLALRIISILSFLGSSILIYRIISSETKSSPASWIGCGLFAASFGVVGYWYDVGRVDSLAIFLILFSAYTLRYHPGPRGAVLSAILFSASFLTKQSALIFLPFMIGAHLFEPQERWSHLCYCKCGYLHGLAYVLECKKSGMVLVLSFEDPAFNRASIHGAVDVSDQGLAR